jgi:hypothetical protein
MNTLETAVTQAVSKGLAIEGAGIYLMQDTCVSTGSNTATCTARFTKGRESYTHPVKINISPDGNSWHSAAVK